MFLPPCAILGQTSQLVWKQMRFTVANILNTCNPAFMQPYEVAGGKTDSLNTVASRLLWYRGIPSHLTKESYFPNRISDVAGGVSRSEML